MNKVYLLGNVGKDPEVKYLDQGKVMATLSVATTDRGFTAPDGTVVQPQTEWHRVVAWGHSAKFIEQYVKCGNKVFIEGKLSTRSWVDSAGVTRYTTEIVVLSIEGMSGNRTKDETPAPTNPPF
ncbi:MAG: single-stranded DNA-binding protein [Paludibacteraceae bacterium]|nr:single-stranded DNA-binding protein [Paludibacteraceae bacterium]